MGVHFFLSRAFVLGITTVHLKNTIFRIALGTCSISTRYSPQLLITDARPKVAPTSRTISYVYTTLFRVLLLPTYLLDSRAELKTTASSRTGVQARNFRMIILHSDLGPVLDFVHFLFEELSIKLALSHNVAFSIMPLPYQLFFL